MGDVVVKGINELPLNKVQKAATELMQCDLKFLNTIAADAYEKRDFVYVKDILQQMHNAFVIAYGTDTLNEDMGFVSVPGVVLGGNSEICLALPDLDTMSSGEHWGTTFLTPYGIYQDEEKCHPLAKEYSSKMIPYEYWYTVGFDGDHHTDLESCPRDIRKMIDDVFSEGMNQNGGITY